MQCVLTYEINMNLSNFDDDFEYLCFRVHKEQCYNAKFASVTGKEHFFSLVLYTNIFTIS